MNYYPHHIGDYTKDTAHLSMLEDGAYRRLIDIYYTQEKALPLDLKVAHRLCRAITTQEKKTVEIVLNEFFTKTDDGWHHKRCDHEIEQAQEKTRKAKDSAAIRWASEPDANAHANASPNASKPKCEGNANPITNNQEPIANSHLGSSGAKKPRRKPATKVPDAFDVSDGMAQWAVSQGLAAERVLPETEKFLDHFRRKDESMSDWLAGWRNWIRKSVEYGARR